MPCIVHCQCGGGLQVEEKTPNVSEETVNAYEHLVHIILRTISAPIDLRDDLLQEGRIGLLDAIRKYNPRHKVAFSTYARYRIYGAMIDLLRRIDPLTRSVRQTAKHIERVTDDITRETQTEPPEEMIADRLGLSLQNFRELQIKDGLRGTAQIDEYVMSLAAHHRLHTWDTPWDIVLKQETDNPTLNILLNKENANIVREAIAQLPIKERQVINLYYGRDLTLERVGKMLNLTQGRASQLRMQACTRLRELITSKDKKFDM